MRSSRVYARVVFTVLIVTWVNQSLFAQKITEPTTTDRYQKYLSKIMQQADTNRDGKIDRIEQENHSLPMWEKADKNGDGIISPEEILYAIGGSEGSSIDRDLSVISKNEIAKRDDGAAKVRSRKVESRKLMAFVFKLPKSFARSENLGLKEILNSVSATEAGNLGDEEAIIFDRLEMELYDGRKAKLGTRGETVGYVRQKRANTGEMFWQQQNFPFESLFTFEPRFYPDRVELSVELEGSYVISEDVLSKQSQAVQKYRERGSTSVSIHVDTEIVFSNNTTSAMNIFSSGHHFLLIFSISDS